MLDVAALVGQVEEDLRMRVRVVEPRRRRTPRDDRRAAPRSRVGATTNRPRFSCSSSVSCLEDAANRMRAVDWP
jgi:hypothetical protein